MQFKKIFIILIFSTLTVFASVLPTIHQVYQAVERGNYNRAHDMIEEVLKSDPNSAKAHYIDAQILIRQGLNAQAKDELQRAEYLSPNLPFVKPNDLATLKQEINGRSQLQESFKKESDFPWSMLIILLIALMVIYMIFKALSSRKNSFSKNANLNNQSSRQGYSNSRGGGFASGMFGGLASGLAAGAGFAAGEELFHHFTDDNESDNRSDNSFYDDNTSPLAQSDDNNFGISDDSSWDNMGSDDINGSW